MRKLADTDRYQKILQEINDKKEGVIEELANLIFPYVKKDICQTIIDLKLDIDEEEYESFIYSLVSEYVHKSKSYSTLSIYNAAIIKLVNAKLKKLSKEQLTKDKKVLFDNMSENIDNQIIINGGIVDPDDYILKKEFSEIINCLINDLRPRVQTIIKQYFGFDGKGKKSLGELAQKYNLARERIRQIIEEGLNSIKRKLSILKENKQIKDYVDDFRV